MATQVPRSYDHAPRLPDEPPEVDAGTAVPGDGPMLLEIGSGRGAFTLGYALQNPGHRVLAFEIRKKYAALLAEKLTARGAHNARCYAGDAGAALARLRPDGCLHAIAVHFPDPWWKARHAGRIVVRDALVSEAARLLAPGGIFFVQTDVPHRAEEYAARVATSSALEPCGPDGSPRVPESPFAPARSNREVRAMADALPIFRMQWRRRA